MNQYMFSQGNTCKFCNEEIQLYHSCGSYLVYNKSNNKFQLLIDDNELSIRKYLITDNPLLYQYNGYQKGGAYYYVSEMLIFNTLNPNITIHKKFSPIWEGSYPSSSSWKQHSYHFNMIDILSVSNSISDFYNNINVHILFS